MFDLNAIISAALNAAAEAATKPLLERIQDLEIKTAALELKALALETIGQTQHEGMVAMRDRIAALEDSSDRLYDRADKLEVRTATLAAELIADKPAINIDEAKMVEALNAQEWFWEKLQRRVDAATEQAVDNHCSTYDHDEYDSHISGSGRSCTTPSTTT